MDADIFKENWARSQGRVLSNFPGKVWVHEVQLLLFFKLKFLVLFFKIILELRLQNLHALAVVVSLLDPKLHFTRPGAFNFDVGDFLNSDAISRKVQREA